MESAPTPSLKRTEVKQTLKSDTIEQYFNINMCVFMNLASSEGGGAILINREDNSIFVEIRFCGFRRCQTSENGGAVCYSGSTLNIRQTCFEKCVCFKKGQSAYVSHASVTLDAVTVRKCAMDRPCGEAAGLFLQLGNQKLFTMNISWNTVTDRGAAMESDDPTQFLLSYAMISYNTGSNMFVFKAANNEGWSSKISIKHCSIVHNRVDREGMFFVLDQASVKVEATNFVNNTFKKFASGGELVIEMRITTDFDLRESKLDNCKLTGKENIFRVSFIDANMEYMATWECWAMGIPSPSASQSVPVLRNLHTGDESGILTFLLICIVAAIPTTIAYQCWSGRSQKDLDELDDVVISNK